MTNYNPKRIDRFLYTLRIFLSKNKKIIIAMPTSFLLGMLINTLSSPELSKNIYKVLGNIFDLKERPLNIISWLSILPIILLPILTYITNLHYKNRGIELLFLSLLKKRISPSINNFAQGVIAWGTALTLQKAPNLTKGWTADDIDFHFFSKDYQIPNEWQWDYDNYVKKLHIDNRNGIKYMITKNPFSFTDSPKLTLEVSNCNYYQVLYCREIIAKRSSETGKIIENIIKNNKIDHPHAFCLHLTVITKDKKILLTKRSDKVSYHPSVWSASIEEQFNEDDFKNISTKSPLNHCVNRLLEEEMAISDKDYNINNLRILSLFLESDTLNVSLAGLLMLEMNCEELTVKLNTIAAGREDHEFKTFKFLNYKEIVEQLKNPTNTYHPTAEYRLLLTLYHRYGPLEMIKYFME